MLTFFVFGACTILTFAGINEYGDGIFHATKDYYESECYQEDIEDGILHVLYNLQTLYANEQDLPFDEGFSITNVSEHKVYYYKDAYQVVKDFNAGEEGSDLSTGYQEEDPNAKEKDIHSLADLIPYRTSVEELSYDITTYDGMKRYLNSSLAQSNYIYFDQDAFKDIFRKQGSLNRGHCFSDNFSEKAYFLFDEPINADEVSLNKTDKNKNAVNLDTMDYAVYDPETELFYSPSDNYFDLMPQYIYNAMELKDQMEEREEEKGSYVSDNLMAALLKSYNYNFMGIWTELDARYEAEEEATNALWTDQKYSSIQFDIRNSEFEDFNTEIASDSVKMDRLYVLAGSEAKNVREDAENVQNLKYYENIRPAFECFPPDTVCYIGVDMSSGGSMDNIKNHASDYTLFAYGIWLFLIGAVVTFVLLIIQTVWLIRTTGRHSKEDPQIDLNHFDRIYTEIWLFCYVGVLLLCMLFAGYGGTELIPDMISVFRLNLCETVMLCVLVVMPFAFFFMILTLSLARRWKAHNYWNRMGLRHFFQKLRAFYGRRKATEQMVMAIVVYTVFMLIGLFLLIDGYSPVFGLFLIALVQLVALRMLWKFVRDVSVLTDGVSKIVDGNLDYKCKLKQKNGLLKELENGINHIGDGLKKAVETSLKDERMKTELITNVSHDLKTPLTSIINYVDLLKKEEMPTEEARHYVEVLDSKAQRLKQLTEDLVEATKANTGNIELEMIPLTFDELMKQAIGEFEDKFAKKNLTVIAEYPKEPAVVLADGRRLFRVMDNVLQNAYKYALEGTRIYADLIKEQGRVIFTLKNISAAPLNISPDELMERFTRGDDSRTTEGSGLGLSIAKDLTQLQQGTFEIELDGDLFKVVIGFPEYNKG